MWKLRKGKTTVQKELEFTKSERLQWVLNALLQVQFSRVWSDAKEEEIGFYSWRLMSWVVIAEILPLDQPTIVTTCNASTVIGWVVCDLRRSCWLVKIMVQIHIYDLTCQVDVTVLLAMWSDKCCARRQITTTNQTENPQISSHNEINHNQEENHPISNNRSNEVRPTCLRPRGNQWRDLLFRKMNTNHSRSLWMQEY